VKAKGLIGKDCPPTASCKGKAADNSAIRSPFSKACEAGVYREGKRGKIGAWGRTYRGGWTGKDGVQGGVGQKKEGVFGLVWGV